MNLIRKFIVWIRSFLDPAATSAAGRCQHRDQWQYRFAHPHYKEWWCPVCEEWMTDGSAEH